MSEWIEALLLGGLAACLVGYLIAIVVLARSNRRLDALERDIANAEHRVAMYHFGAGDLRQ